MKNTSVDKILTQEEFEILRDRSIELGTISGLVENFYDREMETIQMGVVRLLQEYYNLMGSATTMRSYYQTKEIEMQNYLEKLEDDFLKKIEKDIDTSI
jgi:hypothetical protein